MRDHSFFYKDDGALVKINLDEIRFMEARDNYVIFNMVPIGLIESKILTDSKAREDANDFADTNILADSKTPAEPNTVADSKAPTKEKTLTLRTTLDTVLKKLPPGQFLKTHRSFVVSVKHIEYIFRDYLALVNYKSGIPISKQHYPAFIKQINILGPGFPGKK